VPVELVVLVEEVEVELAATTTKPARRSSAYAVCAFCARKEAYGRLLPPATA
jgi:hypothetical protein